LQRGIEIITGESSYSGLIGSISRLRGLLRLAWMRKEKEDGEDATNKLPRFERIR
jgi:hypothetical protein